MRSRPDQTATQSMSSTQVQGSQRLKKASPWECSGTTKGTGVHRIAMIASPWKATTLRHEETSFTAKIAAKMLDGRSPGCTSASEAVAFIKTPWPLLGRSCCDRTGPVTSRESRLTTCEIEKPPFWRQEWCDAPPPLTKVHLVVARRPREKNKNCRMIQNVLTTASFFE